MMLIKVFWILIYMIFKNLICNAKGQEVKEFVAGKIIRFADSFFYSVGVNYQMIAIGKH